MDIKGNDKHAFLSPKIASTLLYHILCSIPSLKCDRKNEQISNATNIKSQRLNTKKEKENIMKQKENS